MAVPGYADHSYNVVNIAFYVPDRVDDFPPEGLADAAKVWDNPGDYLSPSFQETITGVTNPTASQIRTAIKRMLYTKLIYVYIITVSIHFLICFALTFH